MHPVSHWQIVSNGRAGALRFLAVAQVAQSVEQLIRNEQVAGSIPALGSTKPLHLQGFLHFCHSQALE
jgi:hypothetical protein